MAVRIPPLHTQQQPLPHAAVAQPPPCFLAMRFHRTSGARCTPAARSCSPEESQSPGHGPAVPEQRLMGRAEERQLSGGAAMPVMVVMAVVVIQGCMCRHSSMPSTTCSHQSIRHSQSRCAHRWCVAGFQGEDPNGACLEKRAKRGPGLQMHLHARRSRVGPQRHAAGKHPRPHLGLAQRCRYPPVSSSWMR